MIYIVKDAILSNILIGIMTERYKTIGDNTLQMISILHDSCRCKCLISILLKILSVCKDYHAFCERLYPLSLHLIEATSYLSYHNMWHLVLQKVQMLVLTCREWDLKCSLCGRIVLPL